MSIAGLSDGALLAVRSARMLATDQSEIGHEGTGMRKSIDISEFTDDGHSGDELKAFEGHERLHGGMQSPIGQQLRHLFLGALYAFDRIGDGAQIIFEDDLLGGLS